MAGVVLLHFAGKPNIDPLLRIAEETENRELKKKILEFSKGGVERAINTANYNIDSVILYAESLLGTPHKMGGSSSKGIDCSGLVQLVHAKFNIELPHSSHEQARYGTILLPGEELKRGDLVFFHTTYNTTKLVTHAGIYLGDDKFIHTSTSRGVTISEIHNDRYWNEHYLLATRLV